MLVPFAVHAGRTPSRGMPAAARSGRRLMVVAASIAGHCRTGIAPGLGPDASRRPPAPRPTSSLAVGVRANAARSRGCGEELPLVDSGCEKNAEGAPTRLARRPWPLPRGRRPGRHTAALRSGPSNTSSDWSESIWMRRSRFEAHGQAAGIFRLGARPSRAGRVRIVHSQRDQHPEAAARRMWSAKSAATRHARGAAGRSR